MKKIERIPINIWDDYYEDGYVPEGEIQKTYIYVEDTDISLEKRKECLIQLLEYMTSNLIFNNVEFSLFFYDSKVKYPKLVGPEYEDMHYQRWEIRIINLTHDRRIKLVDELNEAKLSIDGIPFEIYSES
jgi:hypothetical protein